MPTPTFAWKKIASGSQGPGPRSRHCLAHDRAAHATVLFGGMLWVRLGRCLSDTWELRDGTWFQAETPYGPPARHRGAMVYDSQRRYCVLFGGQGNSGQMFDDTWSYAEGGWRPLGKREILPAARCGHALAFDEDSGAVVLFGGIGKRDRTLGDTWLFADGQWRELTGPAPPPRRYAAFAYDPDLRGCVLHGGSVDDAGSRGFGDAWLLRDRSWSRLPEGFATDVRDDHGLAYHRSARRLILFEGIRAAPGILGSTPTGWQPIDVDSSLPRHQCSPVVWDDDLQGLLLHGGEEGHRGAQFDATMLLCCPSPQSNGPKATGPSSEAIIDPLRVSPPQRALTRPSPAPRQERGPANADAELQQLYYRLLEFEADDARVVKLRQKLAFWEHLSKRQRQDLVDEIGSHFADQAEADDAMVFLLSTASGYYQKTNLASTFIFLAVLIASMAALYWIAGDWAWYLIAFYVVGVGFAEMLIYGTFLQMLGKYWCKKVFIPQALDSGVPFESLLQAIKRMDQWGDYEKHHLAHVKDNREIVVQELEKKIRAEDSL